jgi:hypothetical protein
MLNNNREVAQAGSAPGLGPGGRRFESCLPDKKESSDLSELSSFIIFSIFYSNFSFSWHRLLRRTFHLSVLYSNF